MRKSLAAAFIGLALSAGAFAAPDAALAQSATGFGENRPAPPRNAGQPDDPLATTIIKTEPTRLNRLRRHNGVMPHVAGGAEAIATAQSLANTINLGCRVEHATMRGLNADRRDVYEIGCAEGPGYIISDVQPPQAADCVAIAGRSARAMAADPSAGPGVVCTLPVNQNAVPVVASYARAAGVNCDFDDGAWVGESTSGNAVYEVGCAGSTGYWVERVAGRWTATDCVKVMAQAGQCNFTTEQERAATVKSWLASSTAAGCDVVDARFMGENTNGAFYEAKCGSGGGYIARVDAAKTVQQVYPCAEAASIGGGCRLTGRS